MGTRLDLPQCDRGHASGARVRVRGTAWAPPCLSFGDGDLLTGVADRRARYFSPEAGQKVAAGSSHLPFQQ
jgi:hypothetical protein